MYPHPIELYWRLINGVMFSINDALCFDKCHIEYNFDSWQFNLIDDENDISIETPSIDTIDVNYIKRLNKEISKSIKDGDYESCITKSRTLLEEIMIYGIEKADQKVEAKGNIHKLYNQFKTIYNMHQDKDMDKRINDLLSGLSKIITSISDMRDMNSDSHGSGIRRINIEKHHATLFANSALIMSEFILSVINNK